MSPNHVDISIILPSYDRPAALDRCLRSLLVQDIVRTYEIIVVDNHPQSGITARLMPNFPTVRWLAELLPGLSRARNCAIPQANGVVIVTTDDDVIHPSGWLDQITAPLFEGDPRLAATTGTCLPLKIETQAEILFEFYGGHSRGDQVLDYDSEWLKGWRARFPELWRIGVTANAAFRASLFADPAIGPFVPYLGAGTPAGAWEDSYCFYRILKAGYIIRYLPEAKVMHAHRADMKGLAAQLCSYRRGETALLALVLIRHGDWRAVGQFFLSIIPWRIRLLLDEIARRAKGKKMFPFDLLFEESYAYLSGPWSLWRGYREARRIESRSDSNH